MVAAFEKLGQFYNVCRKFRERPVNFTLGKLLFTIDILIDMQRIYLFILDKTGRIRT